MPSPARCHTRPPATACALPFPFLFRAPAPSRPRPRRSSGATARRDRGGAARKAPAAHRAGGRSGGGNRAPRRSARSEEHTSELQSLMRISYAVFCLKNKIHKRLQEQRDTVTDTTIY